MTDTPMLEKLARAAGAVKSFDGDPLDHTLTKKELHGAVRAVLTTLRDNITPGMIEAVCEHPDLAGLHMLRERSPIIFTAMIQSTLPPKGS